MHLLHPAGLAKLSFGSNWVQKTKTSIYEISKMLFLSIDFYFTYIASFNFGHFEFEKSYKIKITKSSISLAIFISGI